MRNPSEAYEVFEITEKNKEFMSFYAKSEIRGETTIILLQSTDAPAICFCVSCHQQSANAAQCWHVFLFAVQFQLFLDFSGCHGRYGQCCHPVLLRTIVFDALPVMPRRYAQHQA